ncbi:MAG TPA: hypothetical protein VFA81_09500 [Burkholderiales bacterium]|nr:hypothetical protein [Burkholderiales bacterium]
MGTKPGKLTRRRKPAAIETTKRPKRPSAGDLKNAEALGALNNAIALTLVCLAAAEAIERREPNLDIAHLTVAFEGACRALRAARDKVDRAFVGSAS